MSGLRDFFASLSYWVSVVAYCAMAMEQMCTMILPASSFVVPPEEAVLCLNGCSPFVQYLYKDKFYCSDRLIKGLVDADFVSLQRWRHFTHAEHVMDELVQTTGFSAQDEDQRLIIAKHSICNHDLSFTVNPEEFRNAPGCFWQHHRHHRHVARIETDLRQPNAKQFQSARYAYKSLFL